MVARTPPKQHQKMVVVAPPISPTLLRETVNKVDRCMARLQELQHTVTGGTKLVSLSLSPRSGRNYLRTSLRCKQESLRLKCSNTRRSPTGKLPVSKDEWRKMSLPAMLLGETVGEILQASQFARNVVEAVSSKTRDDPKTPLTKPKPSSSSSSSLENSGLLARRRKEKEIVLQAIRTESNVPIVRRAKSKINFKVSPVQNDKENCRYIANRVSPRNRPWVRKTVLFPNPLFHSSPTSSHHQKFCKTKSPVTARSRQTPHKFLIKSPTPPPAASKFQVKIRSPTRAISLSKKASPPRASSAAARLRRSFSPSRLASKLVSPLKSKKSMQKNIEGMKNMSGLKQRPTSFSVRFSPRRI
ncbi:cyclin family [Perilla frutescens var. frutescens]|nr:cyclin family [Perilla frutescens var. frutescens]